MPVVQRNGFFAEPGIMLCSMMESTSMSVRMKAVDVVKKLRANPPKKPRKKILRGIRELKIPTLKWDASSYIEMIDWSSSIHLPYIIECMSDDEVASTMHQPHIFPAFPVHTQSVERAVKLVSEESSKVEGEESRHGHILSLLEGRRTRKAFDTKKDYSLSL